MEPTPDNVTLLLEHGGITAVFALGLLWMLRIVGMRLISAIDALRADHRATMDKMIDKIDEHTAADAAVFGRLERLEGVLTGRESVTPIEGVPITQPESRSSPIGTYGPMRPGGGRPKTEPGRGR